MSDADAASRAAQAWSALSTCLARAPHRQLVVKDGPRRGAPLAAVWPFGQVLTAAAAVLPLGIADEASAVAPLLRSLERYRSGHGYGPFPGDRTRYFDDNAWVALALLQLADVTGQARHVDDAAAVFEFVAEGEVEGGGVLWVEGERSRNTCSTGPAAQAALRLFERRPLDRYLAFARRQMAFLDSTVRDATGLHRDHVRVDGTIEPTVWSYNQGTPVGAAVLLARLTGEQQWLDHALETARATHAHFARDDGWWRQPPVFNAVYFRNLLALLAVAPDDELLGTLDVYLDRVWVDGRDARTGLFTAGDIGSYDRRPTIDHAGLTQLYAFRAWPRERWVAIC